MDIVLTYFDSFPIPAYNALAIAMICFFSGILGGYGGFGFSLTSVPLMSFFIEPLVIVPAMFVLNFAAGIFMFSKVKKDVEWKSFSYLTLGAIIGMPVGIYALTYFSKETIKTIIGLVVLIAVFNLWKGIKIKAGTKPVLVSFIGMISGFLNGSTSMNGPPIIIYYLSRDLSHVKERASLITFFLASSVIGLVLVGMNGLLTEKAFALVLVTLPTMEIGYEIGHRLFKVSKSTTYHKIALSVLTLIAITAISGSIFKII